MNDVFQSSFLLNRSCIDDNKAFLSTADSYVKLSVEATKPVAGWKGIEYRATFPIVKPPGANFYPPDMDKTVKHLFCHLNSYGNFLLVLLSICSF